MKLDQHPPVRIYVEYLPAAGRASAAATRPVRRCSMIAAALVRANLAAESEVAA